MNFFWKALLIITCIASVIICVILLKSATPPPKIDIAKSQYRVSYDYARECINAYKRLNNNNDKMVTSFLIERQDFLQALGMDSIRVGEVISPYSYLRGYIGFDSSTLRYHMFFTPVVDVVIKSGTIVYAGKDVVLRGKHINMGLGDTAQKNGKTYSEEDPYVLDLNAPCPTTCNFQSMFDSTGHKP